MRDSRFCSRRRRRRRWRGAFAAFCAACGGFRAAEEVGHLFQRPLRGRKTDALQSAFGDGFQPLERERQMRTALGGNEGVDFVDDDGFDVRRAREASEVSSR